MPIQAANNFPTEDTIDFAVTGVINLRSARAATRASRSSAWDISPHW